jgi:hypothetical protein
MANILTNQEILGYLVANHRSFRIRIGECGIFRPKYRWDENKLDVGDIVGTVTILFKKPTLVLSQVHTLWLPARGEKGFTIGTALILHNGDNRCLSDLPVSGFKLVPKDIECIFEKE